MFEDNRDTLIGRREFLTTTGVVIVGFSLAGKAPAQAQTGLPDAIRRGMTSGPPDRGQVDSYIAINADNTATLYLGYVELGQGGPTALRQIAAEELDFDLEQVGLARADTFVTTDGFTAASRTGGIGGAETRAAAAEARRVLLELAADALGASIDDLAVASGIVTVRGNARRAVSYAELVGGKAFDRQFEQHRYTGGIELPRSDADHAKPKPRDEYKLVGTRVPRPDVAEKVRGTYQYVQHVRLPGMLHGRVVWPRGQGAYRLSDPKVVGLDESSIADIPGVRIVRRKNFVGVVAENEWDAVRAARQLAVTWEPFAETLPGHEDLFDSFRTAETDDLTDTDAGDVDAAISRARHKIASSYAGPYQSHGTMAPNCAVADVKADSALIMSSDQGIFAGRFGIAQVLGLPVEKIRHQYYAGSNTYGSSCYRDASQAAAILSQEVGQPVRLQLSREDEFGWDNYGPAQLSEVRAAADTDGKLTALDFQAYIRTAGGLDTAGQLALGLSADNGNIFSFGPNADGPGGGGLFSVHITQMDMYNTPNRRIVNRRVAGDGYLRIGPLRAPMDPSTFFALEGAMDELAFAAGLDPYEFRKRNITDERWLGVLEAATEAAGWTPRVAASTLSDGATVTGRGIGIGTHHLTMNQGDRITYAAAVVDIEVNKRTGRVVAKHVYGAMDCGLAINPGIVENQLVGMANHGVSLALHEEVRFNGTNVTSLDWASYPTLRFGDHPEVTPIVVQRLHEKSSGAGEELLPAVVAAIGNAFFDATGVRLRRYPLTPARVLAALNSESAFADRIV